jgi:hypothetical protein
VGVVCLWQNLASALVPLQSASEHAQYIVIPSSGHRHFKQIHTYKLVHLYEQCTVNDAHRSGAIPSLVNLVGTGESSSVRECAAAVLACMAHDVDVQVGDGTT